MLYTIVAVIGVGAVAVAAYAVRALPDDVANSDYAPVVETQALIADVLPPPAYALEAYACALELSATTSSSDADQLCERLDGLHDELRARHFYWDQNLDAGPVRDAFHGPARTTAEALFQAIEGELVPAVRSGADAPTRRAILESRVQPLYRAHRAAIDEVVSRANAQNDASLASAAAALRGRRTTVSILAALLIAATAFISFRLRRFLHEGLEAQVKAHRATQEAMELAQASEKALAKARDELEIRVLERTRELRAILDNVVFGFLTIGPDLLVREGYTRSCEELLGTNEVAGRSIAELFRLDENRAADFALNVEQVFEDLLPEELNLAQLPQRFELDDRTLRVEARAVRGEDGRIAVLLFTVSDNTRLEHVERENEANRSLLGILRQRPAFEGFLEETKKQLALASSANDEPVVRRVTHTIKGNAAAFGIDPVVKMAHQVEEAPRILPEHLDALAGAFRSWLQKHADVLGVAFDGPIDAHMQVAAGHLDALRALAATLPDEAADRVDAWIDALSKVPAMQLLGPIDSTVQRLATRLGKNVDVVIEGGDTLVDAPKLRPLFAIVPHLVRNALDHGIESPEDRGDKPQRATLTIRVAQSDRELSLVVSDDGRGIDPEAVARAAVERGVLDAGVAANMAPEDKLSLVFLDSVSTKSDVTDVSGRGVGMSAVKAEVEALGGHIRLVSKPGRGAAVEIAVAA